VLRPAFVITRSDSDEKSKRSLALPGTGISTYGRNEENRCHSNVSSCSKLPDLQTVPFDVIFYNDTATSGYESIYSEKYRLQTAWRIVIKKKISNIDFRISNTERV
jgi:hypothetical protein